MWKTIWNRFNNLFKAQAFSVLNLVEVPVEMYKSDLQKSAGHIESLTKAIAFAVADQKNRDRELNQAILEMDSWRSKVKVALEHSQPELAKSALEKKNIAGNKVRDYSALNEMIKIKIEDQKVRLNKLKVKHELLKAKISFHFPKNQLAGTQPQIVESFIYLNNKVLPENSKLRLTIPEMRAESEVLFKLNENGSDFKLEMLVKTSKVIKEMEPMHLETVRESESKNSYNHKKAERDLKRIPKSEHEEKYVENMLNDFYGKTNRKPLAEEKEDIQNLFK